MIITTKQEKRMESLIKRHLKGVVGKIWIRKGFSREQLAMALRGFLLSSNKISLADFLEIELKKISD